LMRPNLSVAYILQFDVETESAEGIRYVRTGSKKRISSKNMTMAKIKIPEREEKKLRRLN
jgi:hypothetical protein